MRNIGVEKIKKKNIGLLNYFIYEKLKIIVKFIPDKFYVTY